MKTKHNREFDKVVGRRLAGYVEPPPHDLFARIEMSLEGECASAESFDTSPKEMPAATTGQAIPRGRTLWLQIYRYAAAAVVLTAVTLFSIRIWNAKEIRTVAEQKSEIQMRNDEGILDNNASDKAELAVESSPEHSPITVAPAKDGLKTEMATLEEMMAHFDDMNAENVSLPAINDDRHFVSAEQKERIDDLEAKSKRRKELERNRQIENYWGDLFEHVGSRSSEGDIKHYPSASLYAGNVGVGNGDITYNDLNRLAASSMMIKEGSNSIPSGPIPMPQDNEPDPDAATLRHMMPLNVGVSLAFPVSNKLSIVSGLNYSYLYSSTKQKLHSTGGEGGVKQELHYLGIPVGVLYSFYRNRTMDIYARGGGSIEKVIYSRRIVDRNLGGRPEVAKMGVRGVEFSVECAAGINFRLYRGLGLYLEPGIAYYFGGNESENYGKFTSYRTDNPVNFTLRAGIRFDVN